MSCRMYAIGQSRAHSLVVFDSHGRLVRGNDELYESSRGSKVDGLRALQLRARAIRLSHKYDPTMPTISITYNQDSQEFRINFVHMFGFRCPRHSLNEFSAAPLPFQDLHMIYDSRHEWHHPKRIEEAGFVQINIENPK